MPAPTLPIAGQTFVDPTFGTTILRVTDSRDGVQNFHEYSSFWPAFSFNSRYFWIYIGSGGGRGKMRFYKMTESPLGSTQLGVAFPPGSRPYGDVMQWKRSSGEEDHMFVMLGDTLHEFDLAVEVSPYDAKNHASVWSKDLSAWLSAPSRPEYLTMSEDNDNFCMLDGHVDSGVTGVIHYQRSTDKVTTFDASQAPFNYSHIHAVTLDKSGRYATISGSASGKNHYLVWDVQTNNAIEIPHDKTYRGTGHRSFGSSTIYQYDGWIGCGSLLKRNLSTPLSHTTFFTYSTPCEEGHLSSWASDDWVIQSRYGHASGKPFDNEIVKIWTNTTDKWQRLAHHRSTGYSSYVAQPHASVSFDGQYVMFTSDWENSGQNDVFILEIPNGASSSICGDVNGDGTVNIMDVQACVNHILGTHDWGIPADVNGDGDVDVRDVQRLVNIVLEN
jgi:hypothetical protein